MKFPIHFTTMLLMGMAVSSVTPQPSTPRLESFGLEGVRVTALRFSPQFGPSRYNLYATTDGNGVYRHDPTRSDSLWLRLGLYDKKITALDIQEWGVGPAIFHTPVVGVAPDYDHGDSTLIYRLEDNHWVPSDSGIAKKLSFGGLASFASSGHEPPGATFAILDDNRGIVYRSNSRSHWWQKISKERVGFQINVIAANNHSLSREVWFAGSFEFTPWLAKSIDQGQTWSEFVPRSVLLLDYSCHSLAFHPTDPAIVYAGTTRTVMKTTDGGKTWQVTDLENNQTYIYGLALDSFDPNHIYAGGTAANQWAMWESFNGGANWLEIPAPQSIPGISSLVADPNETGVVYIGTLGGGVWRYQSDVVAVQDRHEEALPKDFVLEQNYPNPFNRGTVIRFAIPASLVKSTARLAIYNLRGELVRELVNRQLPAGNHVARWDGRNDVGIEVASGIYFCRLQVADPGSSGAESVSEMRKLSLLK